jgi:hypothetical protein
MGSRHFRAGEETNPTNIDERVVCGSVGLV